jgi:hypothetical protein
MDCSNEEAVSLLESWRSSGSFIHCVFLPKASGWHLNATCTIYFVAPELLTIAFSENAALRVALNKAKFSFADPRESKPESREYMKGKYESSLSITLLSGEWLLLGHLNSD